MTKASTKDDSVRSSVRDRYAQIAKRGGCCSSAPTATPDPLGNASASAALGYSAEEMAAVPIGSNMGLGCGNPQAIAGLQPGETLLDLGCGGGFDCFLAARQVGRIGLVIGVDMTPEMLSKARANAEKGGYENVDLRLGEIEHLPVADGSVDVIISNCVINLSPDKPQVYREAFRVLRPGGRVAISDVVAFKALPPKLKSDLDAHCGCVAGAVLASDLEQMLRDVGFVDIRIGLKEESRESIKTWFPGSGVEDFVVSAAIAARKGLSPQSDAHARKSDELTPALDTKTAELIAVGASVAGHCQPCLSYHVASARDMGIGEAQIREAIAVGHLVEKGAMSAMRTLSQGVFTAPAAEAPACCSGTATKNGKKCCG